MHKAARRPADGAAPSPYRDVVHEASDVDHELYADVQRPRRNRHAVAVRSPSTKSAPVVSLAASPTTISSHGSSTLTWLATNAEDCTAAGGWHGPVATQWHLVDRRPIQQHRIRADLRRAGGLGDSVGRP